MNSLTDRRLREAIVRARGEEQLTYVALAARFGVGEATVNRILRLHRETGSIAPRARGGGNRSPIHGEVARILQRIVESLPDATIDELTEALMTKVEIETSRASVMRALQRLGFSRKKRPSPLSNATRQSAAPTGAPSASGC